MEPALKIVAALLLLFARQPQLPPEARDTTTPRPPTVMTAQQDHQRTMDLLHITLLRRGADGRNAEAPNAANEVAFRQHSGGHTPGPNWPTFLEFARRYLKGPPLPPKQPEAR